MSKSSRSPKPHTFPTALVAELDELCVERERAKGSSQDLDRARRDQRIEELQTVLLESAPPIRGSALAGARLERVIKAGGVGTVWRATAVDSGLGCAVKVFHQHCASRGQMLRHFRQGISALRALKAAGAASDVCPEPLRDRVAGRRLRGPWAQIEKGIGCTLSRGYPSTCAGMAQTGAERHLGALHARCLDVQGQPAAACTITKLASADSRSPGATTVAG